MADKQTYTGLSKKQVTCEPYSMTSVEFFDTKPNYFRVSNHGAGRIYCGVSKLPTQSDYDFMCDGENIKMFSEPFRRPYLYILNPTGNTVLVDVLSFYAEFDPLALAFSEIKLDLSGTSFETSTAIDSFNTPLPAGTNNIGKVAVSNLNNYTTSITNILAKLTELIKSSSGTDAVNLHDILSRLDELVYGQNNDKSYNNFYSGTATSSAVQYDAGSGFRFVEIGFFSNDGEGDITFTTIDTDGRTQSMVIKAGEVLNNIKCRCPSVSIAGTGAYRLAMIARDA